MCYWSMTTTISPWKLWKTQVMMLFAMSREFTLRFQEAQQLQIRHSVNLQEISIHFQARGPPVKSPPLALATNALHRQGRAPPSQVPPSEGNLPSAAGLQANRFSIDPMLLTFCSIIDKKGES